MIKHRLRECSRDRPIHDPLTYRDAEIFQKYDGHLYDLNKKNAEEVLPELSNPECPTTPATRYVLRYPVLAVMVNRVLVAHESPKAAYDEARSKLEERLQEGKEKAENFQ